MWPNQALDVLRSRCQEKLLANEFHPAQAQATQPDLIREFREERLHLSSFPLRAGEGGRVG